MLDYPFVAAVESRCEHLTATVRNARSSHCEKNTRRVDQRDKHLPGRKQKTRIGFAFWRWARKAATALQSLSKKHQASPTAEQQHHLSKATLGIKMLYALLGSSNHYKMLAAGQQVFFIFVFHPVALAGTFRWLYSLSRVNQSSKSR